MPSHMVPNGLTATDLEAKWKSPEWEKTSGFKWDARGVPLNLRLRRALSWLARAEREIEDADAAFIFYWISFNAIYSDDRPETYQMNEHETMEGYFAKVVSLDYGNAIYDAIWQKFSGPIRMFLDNRFVFRPFWTSLNRTDINADWKRAFERSRNSTNRALANNDTETVLNELFHRLYVLRNQLMHGGATWQGSVNRSQVRDGAAIMAFLVPHFISLMLDNPSIAWGVPHYPVVSGG